MNDYLANNALITGHRDSKEFKKESVALGYSVIKAAKLSGIGAYSVASIILEHLHFFNKTIENIQLKGWGILLSCAHQN